MKKPFQCCLFLVHLFCLASTVLYSDESCNTTLEMQFLTNIKQLTFPKMGFEKAGEAYFSPDGDTIAFQAVPTNQKEYQIFTMSFKDSIPKMVSTGKGACTCAYFRPDGKKIIFASSHAAPEAPKDPEPSSNNKYTWHLTPYMNIYEANPDGSDLVPLTSGIAYHAECAYSNDGSQIVYASNEDGSMNLYIMNADGSNVRQITRTKGCYNGGPFFSPDGKQIIFRADRERADYLQLYLIDVDGSNEKQLTCNHAVNWAPYWHPNGKVVAYTTSLHGHRHYEIYLLNTVTGIEHRLTYNPSFDGLSVFNADGSKMLWTSKRGDNTSQVFIADFTMPCELKKGL